MPASLHKGQDAVSPKDAVNDTVRPPGSARLLTRLDVVYVHNRPFPSPEANTGAVMQMCAALAQRGCTVRLVSHGGDPGVDPFAFYGVEPGFELQRLPAREGWLTYPTLLQSALRDAPGAVVFTRIPQIAAYAALAGRRVLLEMHYPMGVLRRGAAARAVLDRLHKRFVGVVVISDALQVELRAELPRFRGPFVTAPSGAADFRAIARGAPPPDHDVGFVGSFLRGRGVELVLSLAEQLPQARFLLVGGPVGAEVQAHAARLPNVTLTGRIPAAEAPAAMARFRIGLAPYGLDIEIAGHPVNTVAWMSPMKIIEYLSAERAVVASRFPAVEELVQDGVTALLPPPEDVESWRRAVGGLLANPAAAAAMAARGRAAYETRLTWAARAETIQALL